MLKIFLLIIPIFLLFTISEARAANTTLYLRFQGEDPSHDPSEIMKKMQTVFVLPLQRSHPFARVSWMMQVMGVRNSFNFNLIIEPLNTDSNLDYASYVDSLESKDILGVKVHFEKVKQIEHMADLEIGHYVGALDDPFIIDAEYPQIFNWHNLQQWENFSNQFGFGLLQHDHSRFKNYLLSFVDVLGHTDEITRLLQVSDMMAIRSSVDIILESDERIEQSSVNTPFLPFRFFRNCFQSDFENGACFSAVNPK